MSSWETVGFSWGLCSMALMHYEVLLCNTSSNIVRVIKSRRMRWAGNVARMGEERGVYRVLVRKPEGKRPLWRPRRRWVENIRTDLQEVGCGYMDWIGLAQDRDGWRKLVSAVMNLQVPWNGGNFLTSCKPVKELKHQISWKSVWNVGVDVLRYRCDSDEACEIFGAFAKLRKETTDFVMSGRPSARNNSAPMSGFSCNLTFEETHKML